jgi:hypothetical protein
MSVEDALWPASRRMGAASRFETRSFAALLSVRPSRDCALKNKMAETSPAIVQRVVVASYFRVSLRRRRTTTSMRAMS